MREDRLKHVADIRVSNVDKKIAEGHVQIRLCNYTDVYYNERITDALDFMAATATRDQRATFGLRAGDVVLTKDSETAEDIGVSALIAEDVPDLVCGYHLAVVRARPGRALGGYLRWVIASMLTRQRMSAAATGVTRFGLRSEAIAELPVPIPSIATQCAIANYLDRETARIDALIEAKRRLIALLDEALITRIEASLCHPAASRIPMRRLLTRPPQYGASESGHGDRLDWPRYIRITDLAADGTLREADKRTLPPPVARPYLLKDWDILIARSGATVGKAFAYRASMGTCCFAGYLICFRFDSRKLLPGLAELWTRTRHYWSQIGEAALQATIENVSAEKYKDLLVPVPSPANQAQLLTTLSWHRARTELLQSHVVKQIHLLAERRQALITAAVTGQIDIPEPA